MKNLDQGIAQGIQAMEEHELLNERMLKEHGLLDIYYKEGIPFVVMPVLSRESHDSLLAQREEMIAAAAQWLMNEQKKGIFIA